MIRGWNLRIRFCFWFSGCYGVFHSSSCGDCSPTHSNITMPFIVRMTSVTVLAELDFDMEASDRMSFPTEPLLGVGAEIVAVFLNTLLVVMRFSLPRRYSHHRHSPVISNTPSSKNPGAARGKLSKHDRRVCGPFYVSSRVEPTSLLFSFFLPFDQRISLPEAPFILRSLQEGSYCSSSGELGIRSFTLLLSRVLGKWEKGEDGRERRGGGENKYDIV